MSIRVNPNVSPRIITIPQSDGDSITVQNLVNQLRDWEEQPSSMSFPKILKATGKDDIGGGTFVGITAKLENAKLKFEARGSPTVCVVRGGNILAVDINSNTMNVVEPSANVTVMVAQSSSATITETATSGLTQTESDQLMGLPKLYQIEDSTKVGGGLTTEIESLLEPVAKQTELIRALGLMQENYALDQMTYISNKNNIKQLASARIRIYSDTTAVGTMEKILAMYSIAPLWEDDEMVQYDVKRTWPD